MGIFEMCPRLFAVLVWMAGFAYAQWDPSHPRLASVLERFAKLDRVDYLGLQKDQSGLNQYLDEVRDLTSERFDHLSHDDQIAYLINAYNAYVLKLVSDFFPIASVEDLGSRVGGGLFTRKTKHWRITEYQVGSTRVEIRAMGRSLTLDDLYHQILRTRYRDPRIHFALACGGVSCPPLRREPYVGVRLSSQLDEQARTFVRDRSLNFYDEANHILFLSPIFKWYRGDFIQAGTIVDFVRLFVAEAERPKLRSETEVRYLPFDWKIRADG